MGPFAKAAPPPESEICRAAPLTFLPRKTQNTKQQQQRARAHDKMRLPGSAMLGVLLASQVAWSLDAAHPRDYGITDVAVFTHGEWLSVRFVADGHQMRFDDLHLVHVLRDEPSSTFSTVRGDGSWASVTLLSDNRISGVFVPFGNAVLYEVHAQWTLEKHRARGLVGKPEQINRNVTNAGKFTCAHDDAALRPPPDSEGKGVSSRARRVYSGTLRTGRNLQVQSWVGGCYENDHVRRRLHIGIVVDQSFVQECAEDTANCESVPKMVESAVARASAVYQSQMNLELFVDHLVMPNPEVPVSMAAQASTCTQSYDPTQFIMEEQCCCTDGLFLTDRLNALQQWVETLPIRGAGAGGVNKTGLWHLITNCHPAPGYIGRSFIGTLCHQTMAAGVTSYGTTPTTALWRVMAHEIGHGFNASHTFQNGVGTTGSIMDYGNGTLWGEYQFYPEYSQAEMCSEIASQVDSCMYLQPSDPVCGDGIVSYAEGEQCECPDAGTTTCAGCANCQLVLQCVPGDPCCTAKGRFEPVLSTCALPTGASGYCVQGFCQPTSVCGGAAVCTATPGACSVTCADAQGSCSHVALLPNDTPCGADSTSQCVSGQCVAAAVSVSAPGPTNCVDLVTPWWDADSTQYTCAWYGSNPVFCNMYGDKFRNFGWTAAEACCLCGGGQQAIVAVGTASASPSLQSTSSPSSSTTATPATIVPTAKPGPMASKCPPAQARAKCAKLARSRCVKEGQCTWCAQAETCIAGAHSQAGCADPAQWFSKCTAA